MLQYKRGSSSVHGKVKVNKGDGGRSELSSRAGVQVAREGKVGILSLRLVFRQVVIAD